MVFGIISGFLSALLMSGSYIFSRAYFKKYNDPVQLAIYSQVNMLVCGIIMLVLSFIFMEVPVSKRFFLYLAGEAFSFLIAQTCFFMMLRHVEPSRAASLLGLKIMAIAVLTFLGGHAPNGIQWGAIVLCTIAAVGMNFSGGKLSWKSILWLMIAVFCYAFCDICITKMMNLMPGRSMILNSFCVMGFTYTSIGLLVLPGLLKYPLKRQVLKEAMPYSFFYFCSMIFLMTCFGLLGVVFGSIIQASRGIISVVLGIFLLRLGIDKDEPDVPLRVWIQKLVMAILMLAAMTLYTLSAAQN